IALKRLKQIDTLENLFYEGYKKEENLLEGLWHFIGKLKTVHPYKSCGYDFLTGRIPRSLNRAGTYKRYLMFLRWMVRKDALDMGLWQKIDKKDLLIPLDTHTFHVSRKLGLLQRKSYDMKAVLELTDMLKKFDSQDPVKYDFALYRLGQEKRV
ncbi:MAG: TIGR02757 family protein, partial [Sulfurovum sp.]|nr:TIGR02757 family protein [Sulfurovum sp.]